MAKPPLAPRLTRWQRIALRLGEQIPRPQLHPEVLAWVEAAVSKPSAAAARGRWIVAVSGGSDSVALALLVWVHWPEWRKKLVLAHFDHRLRGAASTADAAFCRRLADGLGVAFAGARWNARPAQPNEATARIARQAFLAGVQRRFRSRVLWTGHQCDDVAETLLMRLARGSGAAGLAAPRPVQPWGEHEVRLRPLLNHARTALQQALTIAGGRWREDASNQSAAHFRNRIRADVVPVWVAAAGRDAVAGAACSRRLLAEDDAALEQWLDELAPWHDDGSLDLARLAGRPIALWRRALHRWLARQRDVGDLSRQGFEDLLRLARAGQTSRFSLGRTGFARVRRHRLYFEKPTGPTIG